MTLPIQQQGTRRRLDDFFSFTDDKVKQHPWYTQAMIAVLCTLLLIVAVYGLQQLYNSATDCTQSQQEKPFMADEESDAGEDVSRRAALKILKQNIEMTVPQKHDESYVHLDSPKELRGVSA